MPSVPLMTWHDLQATTKKPLLRDLQVREEGGGAVALGPGPFIQASVLQESWGRGTYVDMSDLPLHKCPLTQRLLLAA